MLEEAEAVVTQVKHLVQQVLVEAVQVQQVVAPPEVVRLTPVVAVVVVVGLVRVHQLELTEEQEVQG